MKAHVAVKKIEVFLRQNDYQHDFNVDVHQVLQDNRRTNRKANIKRYGKIPFEMVGNRVDYSHDVINDLCQGAITYICEPLKIERLQRAEKALEAARTKYGSTH